MFKLNLGKRGIAGAVVFLVFDRSALFDSLAEKSKYWGNDWETPLNRLKQGDTFNGIQPTSVGTIGSQVSSEEGVRTTKGTTKFSVIDNKHSHKANYHDQIPPFDIVLFAATERGHGAIMEMLGVEILNCGSGVSVDDITTDESCTWVGVNIIPWHSQTYTNPQITDSTTPYEFNELGYSNIKQDSASAK